MQGNNASHDLVHVAEGSSGAGLFFSDLRSHLATNAGTKAAVLYFTKNFPVVPGKLCSNMQCKCWSLCTTGKKKRYVWCVLGSLAVQVCSVEVFCVPWVQEEGNAKLFKKKIKKNAWNPELENSCSSCTSWTLACRANSAKLGATNCHSVT